MSEQQWVMFWEIVLILGLGSYLILAVVIVPFGLRDILSLFRNLDQRDEQGE